MEEGNSTRRSADRAASPALADGVREDLPARIAQLEAELAQLRAALRGQEAAQPPRLTTVKVPAPFETPFLRAQEYVAR